MVNEGGSEDAVGQNRAGATRGGRNKAPPVDGQSHTDLSSLSSGTQKPKVRVLQGRAPSRGSRGGSFLSPPASGAPGVLGLWPRRSRLCLHQYVASPCVSGSTCPFYKSLD